MGTRVADRGSNQPEQGDQKQQASDHRWQQLPGKLKGAGVPPTYVAIDRSCVLHHLILHLIQPVWNSTTGELARSSPQFPVTRRACNLSVAFVALAAIRCNHEIAEDNRPD